MSEYNYFDPLCETELAFFRFFKRNLVVCLDLNDYS